MVQKVITVLVIVGITVLIYNKYKESKKELRTITINK